MQEIASRLSITWNVDVNDYSKSHQQRCNVSTMLHGIYQTASYFQNRYRCFENKSTFCDYIDL